MIADMQTGAVAEPILIDRLTGRPLDSPVSDHSALLWTFGSTLAHPPFADRGTT
jgi:hypothetical protein